MILVEKTIDGVVKYISMEGNDPNYDWIHNWREWLIRFDSPQYRSSSIYGGAMRLSFGGASYSPDLFTDTWPPQVSCPVVAKYTETNDSAPDTFFTGTAHIASINQTEIGYDYYDGIYDVNFLAESTDYDGNPVDLQRALGPVVHLTPIRVADAGGMPTYHKAHIAGENGTDWHAYDDGVLIDGNVVSSAGSEYFSLSSAPVGEVTISGTGSISTLAELVDFACGAAYLNLTSDTTLWENTIPDFSYVETSQMSVLDFLSKACDWFCHVFYIKSGAGYLVGMNTDNGERTILNERFFPSEYEYQPPIAIARATWAERVAVEETIGKYIKSDNKKTSQRSPYWYGSDESFTPMCSNKTDIDAMLAARLAIHHKPRCRLEIPIEGTLPVPREKITWTDSMLGNPTRMYIRAIAIIYKLTPANGEPETVIIEGEGGISAA